MKLLPFVYTLILISFFGSSAKAQLLNYDFEFVGQYEGQPVDVTGELFGLANNSIDASPLDITLTYVGPAEGSLSPLIPAPFDFQGGSGLFEIGSGTITGAFSAYASSGDYSLVLGNQPSLTYGTGETAISLTDFGGSGPQVFFTPEGDYSAAPEPSTWTSLLGGCGLLVIFYRRRVARLR